jgi:hypothetical protein
LPLGSNQPPIRTGLSGTDINSIDIFKREITVLIYLEVHIRSRDGKAICYRPVHCYLMPEPSTTVPAKTIRHTMCSAFFKHLCRDIRPVAHIKRKKDRSRRAPFDHIQQEIARPKQLPLIGCGQSGAPSSGEISERINDPAWRDKGDSALVTTTCTCIVA